MSLVVSFVDFRPVARFDSIAWTQARIEEAPSSSGPWSTIDTITLSPVDADPAVPSLRSFTTDQGTAADQWYRVVWVDGNADEATPSLPIQNVELEELLAEPYADRVELARILKIRNPTADQEAALDRVLAAAALEINAELDRSQPFATVPDLVVQVNLDRAEELWQQSEATLGFVGLGAETGPARVAANTWEKHAHKLAPLKESWGIG